MADSYADPPKGLICPLITPLKSDDTLDPASLGRLLAHVVPFAGGVLIGDLRWGEGADVPQKIRLALVESALERVSGQCPVFIAVTATTLAKTRAFVLQVESVISRTGYPGRVFWVDYPLFYHSNRGLPQMYRNLSTETAFAFILGNHPEMVRSQKSPAQHTNMRTAVLKKLAEIPAVKGMIFSGSLKRSFNFRKAVRHRADFAFYDADEAVFLRNPSTAGVVAGGSNLLPAQWHEIICSSLNRLDTEDLAQSQKAAIWKTGAMLGALYALCSRAPAYCMKTILFRVGLIAGDHAAGRPQTDHKWQSDLKVFMQQYDLL